MGVPSIDTAEQLLRWAHGHNPGPWTDHARTAGRAARTIAAACHMDAERAYALGLLHDIGRYVGVCYLRHGVTDQSVQKWRHYLALKAHFDRKCGRNIYSLFRDEILDALM